jgi:carbonic anhydrase/acetyltransferase-like protein (isoleucine patch superfamily)
MKLYFPDHKRRSLPMYHTEFRPSQIHPSVFIARGAVIVGNVTLAEDASVWFNAVLRGDNDSLTIGARTNIQDGCIFHADPGYPTIVGAGCTIEHRRRGRAADTGQNISARIAHIRQPGEGQP